MRTNWFIILEARGAWWIDNEGAEYGPFFSQEVAAVEAIAIVRTFGDKRRRSQIYSPGDRAEQRLILEGKEIGV